MRSGEREQGALRPPGNLKARPEDFVVEEIPAYEPSGEGEHVFVRFTKRDVTTPDALRAIARALGCDPREAGAAGMKDKRAVTTQTISVHVPRGANAADVGERARHLDLPAIQVHDAVAHGNKLKSGHLVGNRFDIVVRDVPAERFDEAARSLDAVVRDGAPNAFGAQRFGAAGDNAARALAWLRGDERGPRDRRMLRFLWSALQSSVFNAVLDARVRDGTWATPVAGDLLKLRDSGGLFLCSDVETDRARGRTGELSPTGPIIGPRMRWPEGAPADLERATADGIMGAGTDLSRARALGEGSRRSLRVWAQDLRWERLERLERLERCEPDGEDEQRTPTACMRVRFVLPKGAYATTVLACAFGIERASSVATSQDEPSASEEEEPS
jgi:tRNA pseudouridine13 synthase